MIEVAARSEPLHVIAYNGCDNDGHDYDILHPLSCPIEPVCDQLGRFAYVRYLCETDRCLDAWYLTDQMDNYRYENGKLVASDPFSEMAEGGRYLLLLQSEGSGEYYEPWFSVVEGPVEKQYLGE